VERFSVAECWQSVATLIRRPLQCSSGRSEEEEKLLAGRTASQKLLEAGKHHQRKAH
jgi:hypothetical protein